MDNTIYMAMARYLDRGLSVIPLRGKKPYSSWTAFQREHATIDDITNWHDWFAEANSGIVTGAISGIVAIDFDTDAAFARWHEMGLPTQTPTVLTGRGRHLYFAHPGARIGCRVGLFERVDVRGDGGYVVAPPSIHPDTGTPYTWHEGLSIDDVPLAPLPMHLFDEHTPAALPMQTTRSAKHPSMDETEMWWAMLEGLRTGRALPQQVAIPQGRRNHTLTRAAGKARRCGYSQHDLAERIHHINRVACQPPLSAAEVDGVIRHAMRFAGGDARSQLRWLRECVKRAALPGRRASTLVRVYEAHLDLACRLGRFSYDASSREIVRLSGVSLRTVTKRLRDLTGMGLLARTRRGGGDRGSRWLIPPDALAKLATYTTHNPKSSATTTPLQGR